MRKTSPFGNPNAAHIWSNVQTQTVVPAESPHRKIEPARTQRELKVRNRILQTIFTALEACVLLEQVEEPRIVRFCEPVSVRELQCQFCAMMSILSVSVSSMNFPLPSGAWAICGLAGA
jgi:hypothetical protein